MEANDQPPKDEGWPRTYGDLPAHLQPSEAGAVEEDIGMLDNEELTKEQRAYYRDLMEDDCPYE